MVQKRTTKRPAPFSLRLSPDEKARLEQDAAGASIAAHVKAVLFKNAAPKQVRGKHPVKDHQALGELLAKLGASRIASNLNQLAHAANTGTLLLDAQTIQQINDAYAQVRDMRHLLVQSLGLKDSTAAAALGHAEALSGPASERRWKLAASFQEGAGLGDRP